MGRIKQPTKAQRVLRYMKRHRSGITALDALYECGCFDLAGRIRDLKEQGYAIVDKWEVVTCKDGDKARVKKYRLVR